MITNISRFCLPVIVTLLVSACTALPTGTSTTGSIVDRGNFDCFPAGLQKEGDKPVYCETSAVANIRSRLIFASDKPIPGPQRSSVFVMTGGSNGVVSDSLLYLTPSTILDVRKIEAMTIVPGSGMILASTGFDRIRADSSKWDTYNMLLAWPADQLLLGPADQDSPIQIVSSSTRQGVTSSRWIRDGLRFALHDAPYFKVEGLAALPNGKLLFGIREIGASYKDFNYAMKIVSVSYQAHEGSIEVMDDFELVYDFDPTNVALLDGKQVGLSSLEYDPYHNRLYLLTSYELEETDAGLGGFLWVLSMDGLAVGSAPELVLGENGRPIIFAHKSEGLAVINKNYLFVVHDDDRVLGRLFSTDVTDPATQFHRLPNQAAYTIVRID